MPNYKMGNKYNVPVLVTNRRQIMWQTNANRVTFKVILCVFLLICGFTSVALADITGLALDATVAGATGNRINAAGSVTLTATWVGDSPPYTAKFKNSSGDLLQTDTSLSEGTSKVVIPASAIGDTGGTAKQFSVEIIDTAGKSATAVSNQGFIIDFTKPVLTAQVTNGPTFSNSSIVRIQITSTELIKAPTVTCNGKQAVAEGSSDDATSFAFNLQLDTTFTNGSYNVSIVAKDTSEPSASANEGNTTVQFTVGTSATGNTTIDSVTPQSPTNSTTITLSGTCPSGTTSVEIKDAGTTVNTIAVTGTTWSIALTATEGAHSYVAISKDTLGTPISQSSAINVIVDKTAPAVPTVTSTLPTTTNQTPVNVTLSCDETDASLPIKIQAYNNGAPVGTPTNVNSGAAVMNIPLTSGANSLTFASIDAAGNTSAQTAAVVINYDSNSTTEATISFEQPFVMPLPLSPTYQIGGGNYTLKVIFNKNMNQTIKPTLTLTCGGGAVISSSAGTWSNATTFSQNFSIPKNGGISYDGAVAGLTISGAQDAYGNTIDPYDYAGSAFYIDSTAPVSAFTQNTPLYVSADSNSVSLAGTISDGTGGSGVSHLDLVWANAAGGDVASLSIPVLATAANWSYNWDTSAITTEGTYNLWTVATDKSQPTGNSETYTSKAPRTVVIDRTAPTVGTVAVNYYTTDVNDTQQPFTESITRITALINDSTGGSGINANTSEISLTKNGAPVTGEKSYNGAALVYSFASLPDGTYDLSVTPKDNSGNAGETATRSFTVAVNVTSDVTFVPEYGDYANFSHESLSKSQVWATLGGGNVSYATSKISVSYNGSVSGFQVASDSKLIYQLHSGSLSNNQSHDGRYDITVTPISASGIQGAPATSFFIYDSQPPVVTQTSPAVNLADSTPTWFGLTQNTISATLSDAPKDIVTHGPNMPSDSGLNYAQTPGDASWYNGTGSGVNMSVASFSWKAGTETSAPFGYNGTTLTLPTPSVPQEGGDAGVMDVVVELITADYATVGTEVPNKMTASYTYKFDYKAPTITAVSKPAAGKKYTKNTLELSGSAKDEGTDPNLRITKVEYSHNNIDWYDISSSFTASSTVNFSASLDITNLTDGEHSIYVRATDRGGNVSVAKQTTFVVDRTPPTPPQLTFPLTNYISSKRSVGFKWTTVSDANNYLLQIADDAGFNNIVNDQPKSAAYAAYKGQLVATGDANFGLPKDGTYYWRVAAGESCEDGVNVSAFSNSRTLVVDTVKPTVLEVSPSPSSSNKITNGMVTFTLRFSEPMDATVNPAVTLTSAGGQVMKIERTDFKDNTWTGTTVIPKGDSAMYDGNAIIVIEGAKDLAGNLMVTDNSKTVVINTGPAFSTVLFSNPANVYEIMILTKSSESLGAPPTCSVEQNGVSTPVMMNFLKQRYYAGSYKIDASNPGKAYIYLSGTDLHGMVGNGYVQFVVADLNASQRLSIATENQRASLKAAENSSYGNTVIYMLDRETLESPFANEETASLRASMGIRGSAASNKANISELTPVMALEEIGPANVKLRKAMLYEGNIGYEKVTVPENRVHLYRQNTDGNWVFQGGLFAENKIAAQLTGLGRLALMADLKEPAANDFYPRDLDEIDASNAEIKGEFADNGSGLDKNSFTVQLNGLKLPNVKLDENGKFTYKYRGSLPKGKHEVTYSVKDLAGNTLSKAVRFAAVTFELEEFTPYPSPARGNRVTFQYKFGLTPDSVSMKIYDTAGHLVANLSDSFNAANGRVNYDLTNRKGKRIANGVYFYKLKATKNGKSFSKTGKFAVLR